jgi:S-adenosylmethionine/arginine decarboxylase-like enzyme
VSYGKELILDMEGCDSEKFTEDGLIEFFKGLADVTDMELQKRYFWTMEECPDEWRKVPHLNGISAVQFISTSNFTIHALFDGRLFLNVFTCKDFNPATAIIFTRGFFGGEVIKSEIITRE